MMNFIVLNPMIIAAIKDCAVRVLVNQIIPHLLADTAGFSTAFALTTAVLLAAAIAAFRAPETLRRS